MNLDDIVFENRNKEYGAYAIRKHYSDRLNRAVMLSVGFAVLLLITPSLFKSQKIIPDVMSRDDPGTKLSPAPPIKMEEIKRVVTATVQKAVRPLAPRVTTAPEITTPPETIEEPVAGSDVGTVGGESVSIDVVDIGEPAAAPAVVEPPKVWDHTEIMPSYKGGLEAMSRFLSSKIRYPAIARRTEREGTVFVSFIIGPDGNVMNASVVRGISKECDAEALRVISMMPAWNPGLQGGTPVMVRMVLPIRFQLNRND